MLTRSCRQGRLVGPVFIAAIRPGINGRSVRGVPATTRDLPCALALQRSRLKVIPVRNAISTSYAERANFSVQVSARWRTRLTDLLSKSANEPGAREGSLFHAL